MAVTRAPPPGELSRMRLRGRGCITGRGTVRVPFPRRSMGTRGKKSLRITGSGVLERGVEILRRRAPIGGTSSMPRGALAQNDSICSRVGVRGSRCRGLPARGGCGLAQYPPGACKKRGRLPSGEYVAGDRRQPARTARRAALVIQRASRVGRSAPTGHRRCERLRPVQMCDRFPPNSTFDDGMTPL